MSETEKMSSKISITSNNPLILTSICSSCTSKTRFLFWRKRNELREANLLYAVTFQKPFCVHCSYEQKEWIQNYLFLLHTHLPDIVPLEALYQMLEVTVKDNAIEFNNSLFDGIFCLLFSICVLVPKEFSTIASIIIFTFQAKAKQLRWH